MCKKLVFMLMVLAVVGLAVPASAADYWIGDTHMTDNGDGTFSATLTELTPSTRYEFNFYESETETYYPGSNSWFYTDSEGAITIGLNTNTVSDGWLTDINRIGLSTDPGAWTIAGSFGDAGYVDWDISAATGLSMVAQGGGIYKLNLYLPVGGGPDWIGDPDNNTYAWKAVVTGSWDSICEDTRSVNTANAVVVASPGKEDWTFYVDSYTGVVKAIPEPATIALLGLGGLALLRRKRA